MREQNPQSARQNNFEGQQILQWFLLCSENLSASNYPGAALPRAEPESQSTVSSQKSVAEKPML
jgi:hypothetical protein